MTHHVLGKRLSAWSVCCGFLRTLTLDALLDSVQAASSRLSIFSVAGGFALMCWTYWDKLHSLNIPPPL